MLTHIVMIKLKDPAAAPDLKSLLLTLPPKIDVIRRYEVGIDELHTERSYDMVLISQFDSREALAVYAQHPEHLAVLDVLRAHWAAVHTVDYTL